MKMDHIEISGLTLQSNLPKCPYNFPCKEVCETYKLCIPNCKPNIKTILQLFIDTSIEKSHILITPMGKKLVIYGNIHFKILYEANTSSQSVHSAHFDIPLCTFICSNICSEIEDIKLYIEDAFINQLDSQNFFVSMITLVYPVFKNQDSHHANNFNRKNFNYIKNNEHPDTDFDTNSNKQFEIEFDMNSNNHHEIKYDMPSNKNPEIEYHINSSDIEYEIEYEMDYDEDYDIKHEMNSHNNIDINLDKKREYYEYDWE